METLLAEEEEWESALGLPRWPRRGRENEFLPEDGKGEMAPAPTQDSVGLLRRRGVWRTAGGPGERMCWRP